MEKSIIEEIRQLTREFIEGNDDAKKRIDQLQLRLGETGGNIKELQNLHVAEVWESYDLLEQRGILKDLQGSAILHHRYESEGYEGSAFTVYTKDSKIYEVHGSHCSCFGLEDQWEPEETTIAALKLRVPDPGSNEKPSEYQQEVLSILNKLVGRCE